MVARLGELMSLIKPKSLTFYKILGVTRASANPVRCESVVEVV